ncbi:PSP1 domain-containing protein [Longivirga aurantiaca]|uniref:Stage 0 sporulation family protein n=1 Tax=Longivirga aurantiaca TaxID=1837743 RepID=A0ABW1SY13_9ACTN
MPMMMAVTFTRAGRLYYLDAGDVTAKVGDKVLYPTSSSPEVAEVVWGPEWVSDDVGGLPVCAGRAGQEDERRDETNKKKRAEIQVAAQKLIRASKLPMKVSGVDWSDVGHESGRATATVYFTAPTRVDFRQLVRDLAQTIDAKVVLTQLSARDDARVQGGIGSCGRDTCCSTFLVDFEPVTVRMARDQDLPANPMKISGACGRLMCCLKYEHPIYDEFRATTPAVGTKVETPEGDGKVVAHDVPRDQVVVRLEAGGKATVCDRASVCASRAAYDSR